MLKLLLCIFFVGCVFATSHEDLKKASEAVVESFISGISNTPELHEALGIPNNEDIKRLEINVKRDLAASLKKLFDEALGKIKESVDDERNVQQAALEKLKRQQKTDDLTSLGKRDENSESIREILAELGITDEEKRSVLVQYAGFFEDLNLRNLIISLKKMILEKMNSGAVRASIAKFVEKGAQKLCEWLTNKGKEKVLGFFDRLFDTDPYDDELDKRSVSDVSEQIKEYFDELDLDFKQKFSRFGEWVKEVLSRGLEKSKSRIDKVKAIAKELLDKSKVLSKDVATEAMEYLKMYKEELGELYNKAMEKLMKKIMEYTD